MIVHAAGLALIKRLRSTRKSSHILEGMPCANENFKLVSESFALPVPTLYVPPSRNIELLILIFVLIFFFAWVRTGSWEGYKLWRELFGPCSCNPPHLPFLRQLPRPYKIPFSSRPKFMSHDVTHEPNIFLINVTGVRKKFNQKSHFHRTFKKF